MKKFKSITIALIIVIICLALLSKVVRGEFSFIPKDVQELCGEILNAAVLVLKIPLELLEGIIKSMENFLEAL